MDSEGSVSVVLEVMVPSEVVDVMEAVRERPGAGVEPALDLRL